MKPLRRSKIGGPPVACPGFTLLELLTVIVIVALLATLLLPILASIRSRMEKSGCLANLRNVYLGAHSFVVDHKQWPQIPAGLLKAQPEVYAERWIRALEPYKVNEKSWLCPTVQRSLDSAPPDPKNPQSKRKKEKRVDYFATPFDARDSTPMKWAKQPWFIERSDMHGNGNLIIYTDGTTAELKDLLKRGGN
jgi:prepilin-type N-terminal cleavage/methylation domain-containing protein